MTALSNWLIMGEVIVSINIIVFQWILFSPFFEHYTHIFAQHMFSHSFTVHNCCSKQIYSEHAKSVLFYYILLLLFIMFILIIFFKYRWVKRCDGVLIFAPKGSENPVSILIIFFRLFILFMLSISIINEIRRITAIYYLNQKSWINNTQNKEPKLLGLHYWSVSLILIIQLKRDWIYSVPICSKSQY